MIDYSTVPVVSAGPDDLRHVADVITVAFDSLAPTRWLVPDDTRRRRVFAAYTGLHLPGAMIEMTGDRAAVAVWHEVKEVELPAPDDHAEQLRQVCGPDAPRFTELEATFAKHHPSGEHHHLSHIATLPGAQSRGAGAALLRHHFRTYPAWDAYLEAASLRLTALYSRHGFVGRGTFVVGHGPTFWPMWRAASTARATDLGARGPMMSFPPPTA